MPAMVSSGGFEVQRRLLMTMLRGLHFIHSGNLSHRDITPSNFMVTENCSFLISDLGHSRLELRPSKLSWPKFDNIGFFSDSRNARSCMPPEAIYMRSFSFWRLSIEVWVMACTFLHFVHGEGMFVSTSASSRAKEIVRLFGSPPKEALQKYAPGARRAFRRLLRRPPGFHPMVFRDLDPRLVRVLKPMLSLNPSTRATAWQSLQDPIFDEWRGTFKRAPPQISSVMKELAEKAGDRDSIMRILLDEVTRYYAEL
mmetsp:Transcript_3286/g.7731  ORF Transcript_3286/g.7731 Transcript_3286/m.7731 type:complete len:255 (+) Transcript_3286:1659-2423(+)